MAIIFAQGTDEADSGKKTILKVAHIYDEVAEENGGYSWFEKVKEDFEAQNPNVEVQFENFEWNQIDVKMMQDFRSGITSHDVTMSTPQIYPQHSAVGDLADLAPFVAKDWSDSEKADFSWASTYQQGIINGQQIAIPMGSHSRIVMYNKEMFEAAGLDSSRGPQSIDELIEDAMKLTIDKDGDGTIDQYGLAMTVGPDRGTIELTFAPLLWNFGGELWDTENMKADFASEAGIKTTELIWDLLNKYKVVPPTAIVNSNYDTLFNGSVNDKAAIIFGWGSYWIGGLQEKGYVKGVCPPTVDAELTKVGFEDYPTTSKSGFANSWSLSIYKNSENKDLAWKFINCALNADKLKSYPDAGLPIRKSAWDSPEYQTEYYNKYFSAIEKAKPMPRTPYYGELADVVFAALQNCVNADRGDIPEILAKAQKEFNTKFAGK